MQFNKTSIKAVTIALSLTVATATSAYAADAIVNQLLASYKSQGAGQFSASAGQALFMKSFSGGKCTDCHTNNLKSSGKHTKTGKTIEPLAPSVNPKRLSDVADVEKWLRRNCNTVLGRECTPQEKGDVVAFINGQ